MLWEMTTSDWMISLACFSSIAYICGYFIDRILLSTGFGTLGNWLVILCGVYLGIFALNNYGYEIHWYPMITLAVTVGVASATLIFMCGLKRVLNL